MAPAVSRAFSKSRADAEVQGYAFSVDFEEDVLEAVGFHELWQKPGLC